MEKYQFKICSESKLIKRFANHLNNQGKNFSFIGYYYDDNNELIPELCITNGTTTISYNDIDIEIKIIENEKTHGLNYSVAKYEEMHMSFDCDSKENANNIFRKFMVDAIEFAKNKKKDKVQISIYRVNSGWINLSKLPKRNLETIFLDKNKKMELVNDLQNFYKSEEEYNLHGIPYTRKYLLEGLPGTGKTSLIFAIASYFDKNISMLSFKQNLDDAAMMNAVNNMDSNDILVLEDIDALFTNRDHRTLTNNSEISFSGLLNLLDGFGRKNKLVVFMTTNYLNKLDEALIRPGRVDFILNFDSPSKPQIKDMFESFFPTQKEKFQELYEEIKNHKISTALLQKFFCDHRKIDNILTKIPELIKLIIFYQKTDKHMYT